MKKLISLPVMLVVCALALVGLLVGGVQASFPEVYTSHSSSLHINPTTGVVDADSTGWVWHSYSCGAPCGIIVFLRVNGVEVKRQAIQGGCASPGNPYAVNWDHQLPSGTHTVTFGFLPFIATTSANGHSWSSTQTVTVP